MWASPMTNEKWAKELKRHFTKHDTGIDNMVLKETQHYY